MKTSTHRLVTLHFALFLGVAATSPAEAAAPPTVGGIVGRLVKLRMLKPSDVAKLRKLTDAARTCRREARQWRRPYAGCLPRFAAVEKERIALIYKSAPKVTKDKKLERRVLRSLHRHEQLFARYSKRAKAAKR